MNIHASSLKKLIQCPFAYEQLYIKGNRTPTSGAAYLGTTVHRTLNKNFSQKKDSQKDLQLEELLNFFGESFDKPEEEIWWGNDKPPTDLKDDGYGLVKLYRVQEAPKIQPLESEWKLQRKLGDHEIEGTIDLVDQRSVIVDYKTVKRIYSEFDVATDLQPTIYAYLLGGPSQFEFHFLLKHIKPDIRKMSTVRDQRHFTWLEQVVEQYTRMMKAGTFPPRPGFLCQNWCPYKQLCKIPL